MPHVAAESARPVAFLLLESQPLSANEIRASRRLAAEIVLGQLAMTALIALGCAAYRGAGSGISAIAGGGIGVLATASMAWSLLRHGEGATAARIARSLFLGWVMKVGMTVALLVIAFRSQSVDRLPLLAAYAATFCAYWIAVARRPPPLTRRED